MLWTSGFKRDILASSLCLQFCGQCSSKNGFAMLLWFLVLRYNSSKRCTLVVHMGFFQKERFHLVLHTTLFKRCLIIIWHCKYVNTLSYLVHRPLIVQIFYTYLLTFVVKMFSYSFPCFYELCCWDLYRYSFAIEMTYDVFYVFVNLWNIYMHEYFCPLFPMCVNLWSLS